MSQQENPGSTYLLKFQELLKKRWLTPEQVFKAADENGDGSVTREEFRNFLASLGVSAWLDSSDSENLFAQFDTSGDGQINLKELEARLSDAAQQEIKKPAYTAVAAVHVDASSKFVALVAHNQMKSVLIAFVEEHRDFFAQVPIVTTGSTGKSIETSLGIAVEKRVASGPLGGDQAIGGMISEGRVSAVFFFKDPLSAHPHAADIEALTRLCDVHQVPYATNRGSAVGLMLALQKFGLDWQLGSDEHSIVSKYQQGQAKVIASVSSAHLSEGGKG